MAKNLFIIGAGASKDFKSNMPLGEDLINYFANLRCIIICRIVLLVFDAIDNKHSSNDEKELCIVREIKLHDLNILINSIDKEKIFNNSVRGKENIKIKNNTASKQGKLVTYYFWKGVNKERDLKVYVSTKGVYQALKEDFGL